MCCKQTNLANFVLKHMVKRGCPFSDMTANLNLACLFRHAPESLKYMERVRDPQNFRFCAIPQVMAIGTLALCYNNPKVFRGKSLSVDALHAHAITSLHTSVKLRGKLERCPTCRRRAFSKA